MTMLIKIGNSQGVRIPKPIIKQARLEGAEIEFEVREEGLLLKPVRQKPRQNWQEQIEETLSKKKGQKDEGFLEAFLNDEDLEEWEW